MQLDRDFVEFRRDAVEGKQAAQVRRTAGDAPDIIDLYAELRREGIVDEQDAASGQCS